MVSLSAVAYLLSEIISYCKEGVQSASGAGASAACLPVQLAPTSPSTEPRFFL